MKKKKKKNQSYWDRKDSTSSTNFRRQLSINRAKDLNYKFKWHTGNELKLNRIQVFENRISRRKKNPKLPS